LRDRIASRLTKNPMDPKDQKAAAGTVETTGQGVSTPAQEAPTAQKDLEAQLAEANARLAKLAEERDNYKKGMLKAKGKLEDDDNDEDAPSIREIARAEALAALAETDLVRATQERDTIIASALKENKELRLALQNRPGGATATGGNSAVEIPKDNVLSEQQVQALRTERGWDDAKIEAYKKLLAGR